MRLFRPLAILSALLLASVLTFTACKKSSSPSSPVNSTPPPPITYNLGTDTQLLPSSAAVSQSGVTLFFDKSVTQIGNLQPGQFIISTADDGYLKEVVSVDTSGVSNLVETTDASMEDAFANMNLDYTRTLQQGDVTSMSLKKGLSVRALANLGQFSISANNVVIYDEDGNESTTDDQVLANGSIVVTVDLNQKIVIENHDVKQYKFTSTVTQNSDFDLTINAVSVGWEKEVELGRMLFAPFMVGPVVFIPKLTIVAGGSASGSIDVTTGVNSTMQFTSGVEYLNGVWSPITQYNQNFQYDPLSLSASGEVKVYFGPKITLMVYGMAGPYINADFALKLNADFNASGFSWDVSKCFDTSVGADFNFMSLKKGSYPIASYEYCSVIYSNQATFTPTPTPTIPSEVCIDPLNSCTCTPTPSGTWNYCWNNGSTCTPTPTDTPTTGECIDIYTGITCTLTITNTPNQASCKCNSVSTYQVATCTPTDTPTGTITPTPESTFIPYPTYTDTCTSIGYQSSYTFDSSTECWFAYKKLLFNNQFVPLNYSTSVFHSGVASLQVPISGGGSSESVNIQTNYTTPQNLMGGTISFWVYSDTSSVTGICQVYVKNGCDYFINAGDYLYNSSGSWQNVTYPLTTGNVPEFSNVDAIGLLIKFLDSSPSGNIYIDDITISP